MSGSVQLSEKGETTRRKMIIYEIPVEQVLVGERRRQDLGDIEGLAASIEAHGLLHPITVNKERELVCGERRLRAFETLGRTSIPAQIREELTGDRLREVELEENLWRKDLSPFERSRTLADLAALAREQAKAAPISGEVRPKVGRPGETGSQRDVADRIGQPRETIRDAEAHVATAEAFPQFQQPQWNQTTVLTARKALARLPEEERAKAVAFVDEPGIPTKDAVEIIESLSEMNPEQREKVFTLRSSEDERERELALTTAAQKDPNPDPRAVWLAVQIREAKAWMRRFPQDPLNDRFRELVDAMQFLKDEVTQLHKEKINGSL